MGSFEHGFDEWIAMLLGFAPDDPIIGTLIDHLVTANVLMVIVAMIIYHTFRISSLNKTVSLTLKQSRA